jgi:signal transduction histidine kinase
VGRGLGLVPPDVAAGTGFVAGLRGLLRRDGLPGTGTAILAALLLLVSFSLPALVALRSLNRLGTVREYAARTEALAAIQGRLQGRIVDDASTSLLANALIVDAMRAALSELASSGLVDRGEGERLADLRVLVAQRNVLPPDVLLEGVQLMQGVAERETARQTQLLDELRVDATREVRLAAWGFLTIAVLAALFFWTQVARPLHGLDTFLARLREGRLEAAPTAEFHPFMRPVFVRYNQLVERLAELEAAHAARAQSLEDAVRSASSTLLEHQRALSRSERLAAVGETAAGVAHELRNPLAGASMALENLRREVQQPDVATRLASVSGELDRAVRTLNAYLLSARHAPEEPAPVDVGGLLGDLAGLLRYQATPGVTIEVDADPTFRAVLPRERLRGALTNLVLNSLQAMAGSQGRVRISARQRDDRLDLAVEDEGPGFPEAVLASGGRAFVTGRKGGTGLGLAIARRAAQDMGGSMVLYNLEPKGAGVRLEVPLIHE